MVQAWFSPISSGPRVIWMFWLRPIVTSPEKRIVNTNNLNLLLKHIFFYSAKFTYKSKNVLPAEPTILYINIPLHFYIFVLWIQILVLCWIMSKLCSQKWVLTRGSLKKNCGKRSRCWSLRKSTNSETGVMPVLGSNTKPSLTGVLC